MSPRVIAAAALADTRERIRRPAFMMVLLCAVGLGYLMLPPLEGDWATLRFGEGYQGAYNSAYVGTVIATVGGLWLALAGFYYVKNAVTYDETTRVGELLAATPLSRAEYTLGKALGNFLLLASMAGVLAVTALVMRLVRGVPGPIDPVALWQPFLLATLPTLALTAAAAVLFETVRSLRGAVGNVGWFMLIAAVIGVTFGQGRAFAFDPFGWNAPFASMATAARSRFPEADVPNTPALGVVFSESRAVFEWAGFAVSPDYLASRGATVLLAVALALLAARLSPRFDPARARPSSPPAAQDDGERGAATAGAVAVPEKAEVTLPRTAARSGGTLVTLVAGELRLLLRGVSKWGWPAALAVVVAGLVAPSWIGHAVLLPAAWLLPLLVWSRLGSRQYEDGVAELLATCPARRSRVIAEWIAGFTVAAGVGIASAVRLALAGDWPGVALWVAAAALIPALALAAGTLTRGGRLFQLSYLILWYTAVSGGESAVRAVREYGAPLGSAPLTVAVAAAALLLGALLVSEIRHARR